MAIGTAATEAPRTGGVNSPAFRRVLGVFAGVVLWSAILFLSAGTLRWTRAWLYVALYFTTLVTTGIVVHLKNPVVIAQRGKRHTGTKGFDQIIVPLITLAFFVLPVVAGSDAVRFRWSRIASPALMVAIPIYVLGALAAGWSMVANPFLEATVRIQDDRAHQVISSGPYAFVRHPMYSGVILQSLAAPLLLGSVWSYAVTGATVLLFGVRTALEDRTLRRELPGYESYAKATRYRLFPGVW